MAELSSDRAGVVRALIAQAPDSAVRSLDAALRGEPAGGTLTTVKTIVSEEMHDRQVRDAVFQPITPLFAARADGLNQLRFAPAGLARLWRALKTMHPEQAGEAATTPLRRYEDQPIPPIYDQLCLACVEGLRAREGDFAIVADLAAGFRPGADAELIACLELAPIARAVLEQLPAWLARMNDERQAAARLAFKDATAVSDDAGPRLMEILFAHMPEPWAILRVMSAVMLHPGDRYAASSELASFGDRLLGDIERRTAELKAFDYEGGAPAGARAAESLRVAASVANEFAQAFNMTRDGPWGERLAKQKQAMAGAAEVHMKKLGKVVSAALPMQSVRIAGRSRREEPKTDELPEPTMVRRAMAVLTFFAGIRSVAAESGYGSMRAKVQEEVAQGLDAYLEELLAMLHAGEADNQDNARRFLDTAADFMGLLRDDKAAQIVRRRAAAARAA